MGWQDAPVVESSQPKWMAAPEIGPAPSMDASQTLAYKMGQAGAQPAQSLPSYALQSIKEGLPSTIGATFGIPGGLLGMGAGAAVGETYRQARKAMDEPASVMPGVKRHLDLGPVAATAGLTMAIPGALVGTSKILGTLKDRFAQPLIGLLTQGGEKDLATKYIRDKLLSGETLPAVVEAARNAKELIPGAKPTLAQAVGHLPEGSPIQAHQMSIAKSPQGVSAAFGEREAKQRVAEEIAAKYRDTMTVPKGLEALSRANSANVDQQYITNEKKILDALIEKQQNILRTPPVSRMTTNKSDDTLKSAIDIHAPYAPKTLLSQKELASGQHSLENVGRLQAGRATAANDLQALQTTRNVMDTLKVPSVNVNDIIGGMKKMSGAEIEGSPVSMKALESVKEHLANMADKNGIIDARTLYQFKKEGIDQVIDAAFNKTSPQITEKFRAKNLIQVKKMIDDAIEQGGGTGWKDYLKEYGTRTDAIEKAILSREGQYKPLQKTNLADPEIDKLQIANVLDRPVSYANAIIRHFKGDIQPRLHKEFERMYLDPAYFAQQMSQVPIRYRPMVEALMQQAGGQAGAQMGAMAAHQGGP